MKSPFRIISVLAIAALVVFTFCQFIRGNEFSVHNASVYQIIMALITGALLVLDAWIYEKDWEGAQLLSSILFASAVVTTCLLLCDIYLPGPRHFTTEGVWGMMIFALMTVAFSFVAYTIWQNHSFASYIVSIILRAASVGSVVTLVIWLNNVVYSGCWPNAPVGCPCHLKVNEAPLPSQSPNVSVVADSIKATPEKPAPVPDNDYVSIPAGGSLCGTLKMTVPEALKFAKANHLRHWRKNQKLYALVHPGDRFKRTANGWQLIK